MVYRRGNRGIKRCFLRNKELNVLSTVVFSTIICTNNVFVYVGSARPTVYFMLDIKYTTATGPYVDIQGALSSLLYIYQKCFRQFEFVKLAATI